MIFNKSKKNGSTIKIDEAENVEINSTIKDAAIAFFALAQFLIESGLSEVQVRLNLDAAIRQYKRNKRLEKAKNQNLGLKMFFISRKIAGELYVSIDQVNKAIEEKTPKFKASRYKGWLSFLKKLI